MTDKVGKKKIIVDDAIFLDLLRHPGGHEKQGQVAAGLPTYLGGTYLPYSGKDTLRVALGKHWDFDFPLEQEAKPGGVKLLKGPSSSDELSETNAKINVFCDNPLEIDPCFDPEPIDNDNPTMGGTKQKFFVTCRVPAKDYNSAFQELGDPQTATLQDQYFWAYLMQYGIITPNGSRFAPVVSIDEDFFDHYHECQSPFTPDELATQEGVGKAFYVDYDIFYNNRIASTQSGMANIDYENFIANPMYQNCLPNVYALAKITNNKEITAQEFFNLNEIIDGGADNLNKFALDAEVHLKTYYHEPVPGDFMSFSIYQAPSGAYTSLFQYYPLEASLFLYGSLAGLKWRTQTQISATSWTWEEIDNPHANNPDGAVLHEQIIKLNTDKVDAVALYNQWLNNFKRSLAEDELLTAYPNPYINSDGVKAYGAHPGTKLGSLEHIGSNMAFSPSSAQPLLKKAHQYKKYFPMYFEMSFTAEQNCAIGDNIKNYNMGRFFTTLIAATQHPYGWGLDADLWGTTLDETDPDFDAEAGAYRFTQDYSTPAPFVDFVAKQEYENLSDPETKKAIYVSVPGIDGPSLFQADKKVIDLINHDNTGALDKFIEEEFQGDHATQGIGIDWTLTKDFISVPFATDIRNYITYIRDDIHDPCSLGLDECTVIYNKMYAPGLKKTLVDLYEEKKRTYEDIINGAPAYTEEISYVIRKYRVDAGTNERLNVQNIIIPNTTDLNIVDYIDTQVKYGAHASFEYEVFAYRLVFGAQYRYKFEDGIKIETVEPIDSNGDIDNLSNPSVPPKSDLVNGTVVNPMGPLGANAYKDYQAAYVVEVLPSIKLIADKLFSTGPIKILDSPPVTPDVNIVPYRAVNNTVKIILDSSTDTFRAEPVLILNTDSQMYEDIKKSQLSVDGKVEFSSDDRIAGFQVFRVEERPKSYSDFKLHPSPNLQEVAGGMVGFDDLVHPNRKYYYTFRAIDKHGHVSNPTPVYKVELIDEKGAVKPIITTISMEAVENKAPIRECQKYILVKPTDKQIYFSENPEVNSVFSNTSTNNNPEDVASGKKRYKMRITSKGTGKKVDINFSFFKNEK
tara:strand:- start:1846 stop:5073 length:3228 start_codon:yes stop_codon:yes gene_type:complete